MAKVNIDLEKLVCSLLKQADKTGYKVRMSNFIKALKEQCLEYKDGSLHYIGEEEPDFQDIVDEYVKVREKTIYPATMSEQLAFYMGLVVMWNKMRKENEL